MPTKINTWINNHKISEHTVRESVAEQPSAFLFSDQEQMCRVICNSEIYLAMATQHLLSEKKTKKKTKNTGFTIFVSQWKENSIMVHNPAVVLCTKENQEEHREAKDLTFVSRALCGRTAAQETVYKNRLFDTSEQIQTGDFSAISITNTRNEFG